MTRVVCFYHFPCTDGVFSALGVHKYATTVDWAVDFIPTRVELGTPDVTAAKGANVVLLVDYHGSRAFVEQLASVADEVIVLDHHKTARVALLEGDALPQNVTVLIDEDKSGATMVWDHFRLDSICSERLRRVFALVEDHDLWRHQVPGSKAFAAGFSVCDYNLNIQRNPILFDELERLSPESLIAAGETHLRGQAYQVDKEIENAFVINVPDLDGQCLAVITTLSQLRSQMGNEMAKKSLEMGMLPMGAVCYVEASLRDDTLLKVSLRSLDPVDTTVVSSARGGGGHAHASSFTIKRALFDKWRVSPE